MHRKPGEELCRIPQDLAGRIESLDIPAPLELVLRRGEAWIWIDQNAPRLSRLAKILKEDFNTGKGRENGSLRIVSLSFEDMAAVIEEEIHNDDSEFTEGGMATGRTVREFILEGGDANPLPGEAARVIALCALETFLDRGLRFLSTGELRRSLLARCIMANADIAILEELFDALDQTSRRTMRAVLKAWKNGCIQGIDSPHPGALTTTISIERDFDENFPAFDHALVLDGQRIVHAGAGCPRMGIHDSRATDRAAFAAEIRALAAEAHNQEGLSGSIFSAFDGSTTPLVALDRVTVAWGGHRVLEDLSWHIYEGEHWRLEGPNGSGKTTLLGLITGENTQAFANEVYIMGRKRGSGETVWDLKRDLGQVSWQLHREYRLLGDTRLDEVLASGLYDSIGLYRPMGDSTRLLTRRWLAFAGFGGQEDNSFGRLDWGAQRLIIVLRALIKLPRILILDEPCQGLDAASRRRVLDMLGEVLSLGLTTALHVTHDPDERINGIRKVMSLCPGNRPMYRRGLQP